jgi:arginine-tRNA-protein transferase
VAQAAERQLPWLYLGYWIKECSKMSYKGNYYPLEIFHNGHWIEQDSRIRPGP